MNCFKNVVLFLKVIISGYHETTINVMNIKRLSHQTYTDVVLNGRTDGLTSQYTFVINYRNREILINLLLAEKIKKWLMQNQ